MEGEFNKLFGSIEGSPAFSANSFNRSEQNAFKLKFPRLPPGVKDLDVILPAFAPKVLVGVEVKTG